MANWGLSELRLVAPREAWPNAVAQSAAVGASRLLDEAGVFASTRDAVADLHCVLATTARPRGQMKRVFGPEEAIGDAATRIAAGQRVGILFGRERTGLENDDISLADAILTFPVDPGFPSLNLAQAVSLVGYEWRRRAVQAPIAAVRSPPATRDLVAGLFDYIERELDTVNFYPPDKKPVMTRNMRDMFHRMAMSEQDVRTWWGAVRALTEGRRIRKGEGNVPR